MVTLSSAGIQALRCLLPAISRMRYRDEMPGIPRQGLVQGIDAPTLSNLPPLALHRRERRCFSFCFDGLIHLQYHSGARVARRTPGKEDITAAQQARFLDPLDDQSSRCGCLGMAVNQRATVIVKPIGVNIQLIG